MESESKLLRPDYKIKLLLIGDTEVGKTSMLVRFTDDLYAKSSMYTIGKKCYDGTVLCVSVLFGKLLMQL